MQTIQEIDLEIAELQKQLDQVKGTKTEVYTRIVGYHRSVDNWNNGKREEYDKRKTFNLNFDAIKNQNISSSEKLKKDNTKNIDIDLNMDDVAFYKLFTSQFCRNCPPVKEFVKRLSIVGEEVDVSTDLGINASRKYNIMSTPTVLLFDSNDNIIHRAYSVEELKDVFVKEKELV